MRLIDADALIMALRLEYPMIPIFKENRKEWEVKTDGYRKAEEVINDAPTIEPKRGEWKLFYESKDGDNVYKCSCCRFITVIPEGIKLFSFCPNCGCAMTKVGE